MGDEFDTDGSGGIDSKGFGCLLAHLGITWKSARIEKTVKDIDQDENGLIDFKEFVGWFLKLEDDGYNSDDDDGYNNHAKYGNYEHDWDISEEENQQQADEFYATQERLQQEESENEEANQEARWAAENEKDKAERSKKLLKTKLLMPLYVKKLAKKIGELTQKNQTCSNSVTVQAGQPEERASMRVYSQCTEDWQALNPPANTCTAA